MSNTIPQDQVSPKQLDRLAAQRQLYSDAKRLHGLQIILAGPLVIAWSLVVAYAPSLKVYSALWGLAVTILDIALLTPWQKSLKQKAAIIQELFDCDVLQLEWRDLKVVWRPDAESIMAASSKFKCKDPDCLTLRNWYPVSVGVLPIHFARIICQRANCWWDAQLRRRYAIYVVVTVVVLSVIVLLIGFIGGLTLEDFFVTVVAPLLPAFVLGVRQFNEHYEAAGARDRLKEHSEKLWNKAITVKATSKEIIKDCRDLQDEIYDHRRRSPVIFDWIYQRLKNPYEELMNKGAEELVEEALEKISK